MTLKLITLREAYARELEQMGRGYAAYQQVILNNTAECVRKCRIDGGDSLINAAIDIIDSAEKQSSLLPGFKEMFAEARSRLQVIDTNDPMKPYSDRNQWWPRVKAPA